MMKTKFNQYKGKLAMLAFFALVLASITFVSCDKVNPQGVLMAGTAVDDRVKMSELYWDEYGNDFDTIIAENMQIIYITDDNGDTIDYDVRFEPKEYSFLIGADSHTLYDTGRLREMFDTAVVHGDAFVCHLGDIAETQPQYYSAVKSVKDFYADPKHGGMPFYVIPGNHDITRNGWALFSQIFQASYFDFWVIVGYEQDNNGNPNKLICDHYIFLDTASGTLGQEQIDAIESGALLERDPQWGAALSVRNRFVFTHTNFFRPKFTQFSSTYCREEMYYLLKKCDDWNATMVFAGHVHAWDHRFIGDVEHLTFDSMSERCEPNPGDFLIRVTISKDGKATWKKVHQAYVNNTGYPENDYHHLQWEVDSGLRPYLRYSDFKDYDEDDVDGRLE